MLNFLKRRPARQPAATHAAAATPVAAATDLQAASTSPPAPAPEATSPQMPTPMLTAEMLDRFIRNLARSGQFQRTFEGDPNFHCEMMPQQVEALRHKTMLAGGMIDQSALTVSFAGITGLHLAKLAVDVIMETLFDLKPQWNYDAFDDTGTLSARLPFGPPKHWMLIDCITQPVDPWFTGAPTDGASLRISMVEEG